MSRLGWLPTGSKDLLVSASPALGLQACPTMPGFMRGFQRPCTHHYACVSASTLLTKSSPPPPSGTLRSLFSMAHVFRILLLGTEICSPLCQPLHSSRAPRRSRHHHEQGLWAQNHPHHRDPDGGFYYHPVFGPHSALLVWLALFSLLIGAAIFPSAVSCHKGQRFP